MYLPKYPPSNPTQPEGRAPLNISAYATKKANPKSNDEQTGATFHMLRSLPDSKLNNRIERLKYNESCAPLPDLESPPSHLPKYANFPNAYSLIATADYGQRQEDAKNTSIKGVQTRTKTKKLPTEQKRHQTKAGMELAVEQKRQIAERRGKKVAREQIRLYRQKERELKPRKTHEEAYTRRSNERGKKVENRLKDVINSQRKAGCKTEA
ncbi:hypothetical protein CC80DRAFT_582931 [Byssothecium circinans]|uniref:Uncharacterized protein n=1 Tax=Byssothecium circinans TaxID=147558 RepID=A0A6A5U676_9PLEO|nr:hypothetical protein CC80DRAFT_582931 [Byssothecium circinans]